MANCKLYDAVSSDTNFIPHKKNNYWSYCYSINYAVGNESTVISDTFFNNAHQFIIRNHITSKNINSIVDYLYLVDSLSNYNMINSNTNDTIKIINPVASNGDTIYKNTAKSRYVILINKNETFKSITGCYHIVEIRPYSANPYMEYIHHFYKRGLGEIYFTNKWGSSEEYALTDAKIY